MAILISLLSLLFLISSYFWVRPSRKQRQTAKLRSRALKAGFLPKVIFFEEHLTKLKTELDDLLGHDSRRLNFVSILEPTLNFLRQNKHTVLRYGLSLPACSQEERSLLIFFDGFNRESRQSWRFVNTVFQNEYQKEGKLSDNDSLSNEFFEVSERLNIELQGLLGIELIKTSNHVSLGLVWLEFGEIETIDFTSSNIVAIKSLLKRF